MTTMQSVPDGYFDIMAARNPRWSDASRRTITLEVLFGWARDGGTYVPFTASPDDGEAHGRCLFADAQAGKYGAVAPPPAATAEGIQAEMALCTRQATAALNALRVRQETLQDALDLGMGGDDTQAALDAIRATVQSWKIYRVKVSQVPAHAAYPQNVAWPDAPEVTAENEAVGGKADE